MPASYHPALCPVIVGKLEKRGLLFAVETVKFLKDQIKYRNM